MRAMPGFPFQLGLPEFSFDLVPVFKCDALDAGALEGGVAERSRSRRLAAGDKRGQGNGRHADDCADLLHGLPAP
jgi:hypothetical protein